MRSQVTSTSVILWSLLNVVRAGALVARQSDANSRTIDLRGPQVIYEGPWEDITSPCNLGSIARRSDNSRAEDAKAVITFSDDVKAFSLSMQALSEVISYTVAFDGVKNRYDAKNNPSIPAGQSGCPVLVTHEFTGNSSKNVSISLQLPRSAKRGQPVKRQGFELPWIQINEVKALFTTAGISSDGTQPDTATPTATSTPGAAMTRFVLHGSIFTIIAVNAVAVLLAWV